MVGVWSFVELHKPTTLGYALFPFYAICPDKAFILKVAYKPANSPRLSRCHQILSLKLLSWVKPCFSVMHFIVFLPEKMNIFIASCSSIKNPYPHHGWNCPKDPRPLPPPLEFPKEKYSICMRKSILTLWKIR